MARNAEPCPRCPTWLPNGCDAAYWKREFVSVDGKISPIAEILMLSDCHVAGIFGDACPNVQPSPCTNGDIESTLLDVLLLRALNTSLEYRNYGRYSFSSCLFYNVVGRSRLPRPYLVPHHQRLRVFQTPTLSRAVSRFLLVHLAPQGHFVRPSVPSPCRHSKATWRPREADPDRPGHAHY